MFYVSNINGAQIPYDSESYALLRSTISPSSPIGSSQAVTANSPASPPSDSTQTNQQGAQSQAAAVPQLTPRAEQMASSVIHTNYSAVGTAAASVKKTSEQPPLEARVFEPKTEETTYGHIDPVPNVEALEEESNNSSQSTDESKKQGEHGYSSYNQNTTEREPAVFASQIMTSPVMTLMPQALIEEARILFIKKRFRHLPIVSHEGKIVGIISDRDIFMNDKSIHSESQPTVSSIMKTNVLTARPATEIRSVASVMFKQRIGAMPIVDESEKLVGILTRSDILKAVINRAPLELWT